MYPFLPLPEEATLVSPLPLPTCCILPWLYLELTLILDQTDLPVNSLLLPSSLLHGLFRDWESQELTGFSFWAACYLLVLGFYLDTLNL